MSSTLSLTAVSLIFLLVKPLSMQDTRLGLTQSHAAFGAPDFVAFPKEINSNTSVAVSTVTSQQEGRWFKSQSGPFCVAFGCSSCVCVLSLWVLQLPPNVQKHALMIQTLAITVWHSFIMEAVSIADNLI